MLGALTKQFNDKLCATIDTLIGAEVELKGDISFSGGLRIDGKVTGNVTLQGAGSSLLILGEQGEIHGNVTVAHMIINGKISGNVQCAERLQLQSQAEILGDVRYKVIAIAQGAVIKGKLVCEQANADKGAVTRFRPIAVPSDAKP